MSLIQQVKKTASGKIPMPELKNDGDGGNYYEELPPATSVATISDFTDHNDNYITNIPYLIHSEVNPERYWASRTKTNLFTQLNDFYTFLERGRVYVFDDRN